MSQNKPLVSASDIGSWTYCNRAWWLAKVQNAPHQNPERLQWGEEVHLAHGQQVIRANRLHKIALYLIIIGSILTLLFFMTR